MQRIPLAHWKAWGDILPLAVTQMLFLKYCLYSAVMQETLFDVNFLSIWPESDSFDLEAVVKEIGRVYLSIFNTPEGTAFTRTIIRDSNRHPEISQMYRKNGIGYVAECLETVLK